MSLARRKRWLHATSIECVIAIFGLGAEEVGLLSIIVSLHTWKGLLHTLAM